MKLLGAIEKVDFANFAVNSFKIEKVINFEMFK
jgi:hypothetical protein